jgi:hypothetical protein
MGSNRFWRRYLGALLAIAAAVLVAFHILRYWIGADYAGLTLVAVGAAFLAWLFAKRESPTAGSFASLLVAAFFLFWGTAWLGSWIMGPRTFPNFCAAFAFVAVCIVEFDIVEMFAKRDLRHRDGTVLHEGFLTAAQMVAVWFGTFLANRPWF